ncbi:hypothetical protein DI270_031890 [Microbispora triticiradicis]|uniref:Uncharacterized protein n=1 Tax=Microbispora triticiradicis TaxID=2200763 RepID=A0ABX9LAL7_9ACTN|nr:hypothetical protein DI270_031890 [Microbispora triticiradicis]
MTTASPALPTAEPALPPDTPTGTIPLPVGGSAAVPPQAGGARQPQAPLAIPGYLPLPPLASHSREDGCGHGHAAGCWSLAPWRSRTSGFPLGTAPGGQADSPAMPQWAFAPPGGKNSVASPSGVPGVFTAPRAAFDGAHAFVQAGSVDERSGCWAFSPSVVCARAD